MRMVGYEKERMIMRMMTTLMRLIMMLTIRKISYTTSEVLPLIPNQG